MSSQLQRKVRPNQYTPQNRLPNFRSRTYLTTYLRQRRLIKSSSPVRASLGLTRWMFTKKWAQEKQKALHKRCFLSDRARGTTQRFSISRVKVKPLFALAVLLGVRKSSW